MWLLLHSILNILSQEASNLLHSWCNLDVESNDPVIRVGTAIYSNIWKYHCEKAEMGLDDPKLVSVHMSFHVWVHAICTWSFKGEQVLLFYNMWSSYCHSRYIYQSIHRGATARPILSLTTDNMYIIKFPGFWMCYPMICIQELLMTASVASVNSPSM